jgi:hypothetical protein
MAGTRKMTDEEVAKLQLSAAKLREVIDQVTF